MPPAEEPRILCESQGRQNFEALARDRSAKSLNERIDAARSDLQGKAGRELGHYMQDACAKFTKPYITRTLVGVLLDSTATLIVSGRVLRQRKLTIPNPNANRFDLTTEWKDEEMIVLQHAQIRAE